MGISALQLTNQIALNSRLLATIELSWLEGWLHFREELVLKVFEVAWMAAYQESIALYSQGIGHLHENPCIPITMEMNFELFIGEKAISGKLVSFIYELDISAFVIYGI